MAEFRQHIPSFISGVEREVFTFDSFEELMNRQSTLLPDHKWCYNDYVDKTQLLMIENKDNTEWFVIGYVEDFDLSKYLPKVIYGDENDEVE